MYVGRADRQVQLRGYRIELGEIESALLTVPGVREAAVRLDDRAGVEPRLIGYLVAEGPPIPTTQIRQHLRRRLPGYMIPACVRARRPVRSDRQRQTRRDSAAAPAPARGDSRPDADTPGGHADAPARRGSPGDHRLRGPPHLAGGAPAEHLDPDENFFDVGGTSMHLADLHRRMSDRFAVHLEIVDFFEHTTIRSQSGFLSEVIGRQ